MDGAHLQGVPGENGGGEVTASPGLSCQHSRKTKWVQARSGSLPLPCLGLPGATPASSPERVGRHFAW